MKRIFKRNQIIITTLAIMIAIAGYLNYSGRILEENADTVSVTDSTVLLTDEDAGIGEDTYTDIVSLDDDGTMEEDTPSGVVGEAVLASTGAGESILAAARLNREQVRAKSKEALLEVVNNSEIDQEQKQNAATAMTELALAAEKEAAAELLLEAKGFEDCVVSISDGSVDVVVNEAELSEAQRAQIEDIVKRKTETAGENIVITPGLATLEEPSAPEEQTEQAALQE